MTSIESVGIVQCPVSSVQWKVVWGRGSQCELLQFGSVGGEAVKREFWIVGFEF